MVSGLCLICCQGLNAHSDSSTVSSFIRHRDDTGIRGVLAQINRQVEKSFAGAALTKR